MPAWSGGLCPQCGEEMPPNLIHCQTCRALLNADLKVDSVAIPEYQPLQEIVAMVEVELRGYYISCPLCQQELRIARKYVGKEVRCKICHQDFRLEVDGGAVSLIGFFADCPHCKEELRSSPKYLGMKVACKHCQGHIHFVSH